jgi:hypothetical protein
MRKSHSRERLTIGSFLLAAAMLALIPWWPAYGDDPAPFVSSSILAVVLLLAAILAHHGRVRDAASIALAAGAWALLSPILLAFWDQAVPFWSHIVAGIVALLLSAREADWSRPNSQAVPLGTLIGGGHQRWWDPRRPAGAARRRLRRRDRTSGRQRPTARSALRTSNLRRASNY